jgi:hypothetical protein
LDVVHHLIDSGKVKGANGASELILSDRFRVYRDERKINIRAGASVIEAFLNQVIVRTANQDDRVPCARKCSAIQASECTGGLPAHYQASCKRSGGGTDLIAIPGGYVTCDVPAGRATIPAGYSQCEKWSVVVPASCFCVR